MLFLGGSGPPLLCDWSLLANLEPLSALVTEDPLSPKPTSPVKEITALPSKTKDRNGLHGFSGAEGNRVMIHPLPRL